MHRDVILRSILDIGVVPVVRTSSAESAVLAIEAVYRGGIAPPKLP
jgi:2-keto-3-deoxy-6-phosphogluconate aldolase